MDTQRAKTSLLKAIRSAQQQTESENRFNVLAGRLENSAVLDLFAGSGALGIEALSRGATHATFVDKDYYSINLVKSNLELINENQKSTVLKGDVFRICRKLAEQSQAYDVIFADPPYCSGFHDRVVSLILECNLLNGDGVLVYETAPEFEFKETLGCFREIKIKTYGDTKTWFMFL